jgi:hypothetical protein
MTSLEQLPAELSFAIYQGATFSLTLTWETGDDPAPVNLTGFTAAMKVKAGEDLVIELTTENGGITLGGALGTILLSIDAEDTADFAAPASATYDLLLTSAGGVVTPLVTGLINIRESVTGGE